MSLFTEREMSVVEALADLGSLSDFDLGQVATLVVTHMCSRYEMTTDEVLEVLRVTVAGGE